MQRTEGRGLGSDGVTIGAPSISPFGTKGEKPGIYLRSGKIAPPPSGERIQPALAARAEVALRQAARSGNKEAPPIYGIVVLSGRLGEAEEASLKAAGAKALGFYPPSGYVVRLPATAILAASQAKSVMWIGEFTPEQKLSADMGPTLQHAARQPGEAIDLIVSFHEPENESLVRPRVEGLGASLELYDPRLGVAHLRTNAAGLTALLDRNDVAAIEPLRKMRINSNQNMQSISVDYLWGDYDPLPWGSGNQVKCGITDSGVYIAHQDFQNIAGGTSGWNFIGGETWSNDINGHGTFVASEFFGEGIANPKYRGVAAALRHRGAPGTNPDLIAAQTHDQSGWSQGNSTILGIQLMGGYWGAFWLGDGFVRNVYNASWGANPGASPWVGSEYECRLVDADFRRGVLAVYSNGNAGPMASTVGLPACAKGALAVGNIYNDEWPDIRTDWIAEDSSRGPTGDNRVKPDVVAPGRWIGGAARGTTNGYLDGWNGTSMAAPHVAGLAAGLMGRYYGWPAWVIRSIITANAVDIGLASGSQGRGKVDAALSHWGIDGGWYSWWWENGGTGDNRYVDLTVGSPMSLLKIVMVYPDAPAAANAPIALVNDLDIYVDGPGGADGWSISARDNVEVVTLTNVPAGLYRIRVHSYGVPQANQPWAITARWVHGATSPSHSIWIDAPYAVRPNTSFNVVGNAYAWSYVSAGLTGMIIDDVGMDQIGHYAERRGWPSTNAEYIWYPWVHPAPPSDRYLSNRMNFGNIPAGNTRKLHWVFQGTTEGTKNLEFRIDNSQGAWLNTFANVIVDGTAPTVGATDSRHWGVDLKPDVYCQIQDSLAGIVPNTAWYRWSTDGGATWSGWVNTASTGWYGYTGLAEIVAVDVPFGQNSSALNRIQFYIEDTAGNYAYGPAVAVSAPKLQSVTLAKDTIAGGLPVDGEVILNGPAPVDGAVVYLWTDIPAAGLPASVLVPQGQTKASFTVNTVAVAPKQVGSVFGTYGGPTKSAPLTVRPVRIKTFTITPSTVQGGTNAAGDVVLEAPAGPGDITVTFTTSHTAAKPNPAVIVIPQGQISGSTTIRTKIVLNQKIVTITATANNKDKTDTITVNP